MNVIGFCIDEYDDGTDSERSTLGNRQTHNAMNNGAVDLESLK